MQRHAAILRPKFEAVTQIFASELGGKGIATWTEPRGGYFVSLDTLDGCAKEVVSLANQAGVKLYPPRARRFPYGKDPRDRNIRVAPSLPPLGADPRRHGDRLRLCRKSPAAFASFSPD